MTETEIKYKVSILKKKLHEKDIVEPEELMDIFNKAMRTLKVLMEYLNLGKAFEVIKESY